MGLGSPREFESPPRRLSPFSYVTDSAIELQSISTHARGFYGFAEFLVFLFFAAPNSVKTRLKMFLQVVDWISVSLADRVDDLAIIIISHEWNKRYKNRLLLED